MSSGTRLHLLQRPLEAEALRCAEPLTAAADCRRIRDQAASRGIFGDTSENPPANAPAVFRSFYRLMLCRRQGQHQGLKHFSTTLPMGALDAALSRALPIVPGPWQAAAAGAGQVVSARLFCLGGASCDGTLRPLCRARRWLAAFEFALSAADGGQIAQMARRGWRRSLACIAASGVMPVSCSPSWSGSDRWWLVVDQCHDDRSELLI